MRRDHPNGAYHVDDDGSICEEEGSQQVRVHSLADAVRTRQNHAAFRRVVRSIAFAEMEQLSGFSQKGEAGGRQQNLARNRSIKALGDFREERQGDHGAR